MPGNPLRISGRATCWIRNDEGSMRAGVPTMLVPPISDQSFLAQRVAELGAGPQPIIRRQLIALRLAEAIATAVKDTGIQTRAAAGSSRRPPPAGRTIGFSVFSIWVMPWDRFIPLTPFGTLWRMPVANRKAVEEFMQVAQRLLPTHSIPSVTPTEGALYHDIRRYADHLFSSE